jgi:2-aminomuconate deaminase
MRIVDTGFWIGAVEDRERGGGPGGAAPASAAKVDAPVGWNGHMAESSSTPRPPGPPSVPTHSRKAAEPVGAYAHARRAGDLLFLAGLGPRRRGSKDIPGVVLDSAGNVLRSDIEAQVRACFDNVRVVLHEAGSDWDKIVDVQVFMTDLKRDFAAFNRLWGEYFPNPATQPTRTTIEVAALPQAGNAPINIELKVVATV